MSEQQPGNQPTEQPGGPTAPTDGAQAEHVVVVGPDGKPVGTIPASALAQATGSDAAGEGEWCIALRSAEISRADPSRLRLFAGCGIVAASDPDSEWAESEAKLEPMREALRATTGER